MVISFKACVPYGIEQKAEIKRILLAFIRISFELWRMRNMHSQPFHWCRRKTFFSKKLKQMCIEKCIGIGKSNQHVWTSYMVKLIFFFPIYIQDCPVLLLGFCTLWGLINSCPKILWQLLGNVFLLKKTMFNFKRTIAAYNAHRSNLGKNTVH